MPAWKGTLSESDLDTLAGYVTNPQLESSGGTLFGQHCAACHGDRPPSAPDKESAAKIISSGGAHVTMPIWGNILTTEQLNALVEYTYDASKGGGIGAGATLFAQNCSLCHGQFGEGGPNPTRAGDVIAPISSAEYLKTRDDVTLRKIISQGQPNFGMSPFGAENGGPLDADEVDAIVAFIRSWEVNPPVELPPEIISATPVVPSQPSLSGTQIYVSVCSSCHGPSGEGGIGPALNTQEFQDSYSDQAMFDIIDTGHDATSMIAWGEILTSDQISQLVHYIRTINSGGANSGPVSYSGQVVPIFEVNCSACHNSDKQFGGWDATSYETVMTSGENAPVIIAGDVENSILAQFLQGSNGKLMPPLGGMSQEDIQAVLDWIAEGAENN